MNIHKNARLTPRRREEMACAVLGGKLSKAQAARVNGVSPKIVARWAERFGASGRAAMMDRSSRPTSSPRQTHGGVVEQILHLRRQRLTGKHIAMETGVSPATVSRVLRRAGLSRMKDIDPAEPVVRYEYAEPGGMIHLDIKRLGCFERVGHRITGNRTGQSNSRGVGWEYVHVCIDDASRIAFTDIFPDEKAVSAIAFLKAAIAYYESLGITVTRVMTDNGSCYVAKQFSKACKMLGLKHIRTRPYTPRTNGKAERFIQTALREWAYARAYPSSESRKSHLPNWTHMYNWHRPHGALKSKTPISRLGLTRDNLLRFHT
ncbi:MULTISPECIES: IS481 family transposase [unclassified Rhizobium]|uniref:IS481 family transposase n=1 Tax=unclassified Rhizobium TaxID=2613769 RepID=UPI001ADBF3F5|nr:MULTISPECIES: IS481 family transposase [unclassified Rhizobium]MBO9127828.1 IS481 family transposase [Rhizobium sp. 16-488-2b]MBO9176948.1 IS481 family transposase [Rhizobium sp. 16-488-2a]